MTAAVTTRSLAECEAIIERDLPRMVEYVQARKMARALGGKVPYDPIDSDPFAQALCSDELASLRTEALGAHERTFIDKGRGLALIRDNKLYKPRTDPAEEGMRTARLFLAERLICPGGSPRGRGRGVAKPRPSLEPLLIPNKAPAVGVIYFLRAGADGPVKIGWSQHVPKRAPTIQSWEPRELQVLATLPGSVMRERAIHARFARYQVRGEWFDAAPELLDYIASIQQQEMGA